MQNVAGRYQVLAADDNVISLKLLTKQLQIMGFADIETVNNGQAVKDRLREKHFDIVFLDWAMPKRDGLSVIEDCRRDKQYDSIAFVMISAESQPHYIDEAMRAGATSYLVKPVTQEILEEKMKTVLEWLERNRAVLSNMHK